MYLPCDVVIKEVDCLIFLIRHLNFHLGTHFCIFLLYFWYIFITFLLHFQEFIRLHICTDQLSLEKLGYVEDDGEDEGRDDVGGEVQGGGRGHLRMNKVKKSKMGHNFILKSTNIVTFFNFKISRICYGIGFGTAGTRTRKGNKIFLFIGDAAGPLLLDSTLAYSQLFYISYSINSSTYWCSKTKKKNGFLLLLEEKECVTCVQ